MLAGLSQCWTFSTPPGFWAKADTTIAAMHTSAAIADRNTCFTSLFPLRFFYGRADRQRSRACLPVEPHVFHAVAVVDAVDHRHVVLDVRVPAGAGAVVVNHRAGHVL